MGKVGYTTIDNDTDHCVIPRCREEGELTYTYAGVSIGVCTPHWIQHCCKVPTVNLKQICEKLADGKKVEN